MRLAEHLADRKSHSPLQFAFKKYGLENFSFIVYEYFTYTQKEYSQKLLTDLETRYIKAFPFEELYNYMQTATNSRGYKHTLEAKEKNGCKI